MSGYIANYIMLHCFGDESDESVLEAYGIFTKYKLRCLKWNLLSRWRENRGIAGTDIGTYTSVFRKGGVMLKQS
jgi:hypothetical protein